MTTLQNRKPERERGQAHPLRNSLLQRTDGFDQNNLKAVQGHAPVGTRTTYYPQLVPCHIEDHSADARHTQTVSGLDPGAASPWGGPLRFSIPKTTNAHPRGSLAPNLQATETKSGQFLIWHSFFSLTHTVTKKTGPWASETLQGAGVQSHT